MPWADQEQFQKIYENEGSRASTSWLYEQSKSLDLIHNDGTSSGTHWQHESSWGPILISINEAKPEKDPREIAAAAHEAVNSGSTNDHTIVPATDSISNDECVFCWDSPAEKNHLRVRLNLHDEPFSLHFSPYAYFPEHCIVSTEAHRPMIINDQTIDDLMELCTLFPDYFFGSNADLPIVGGSILNHHHYQGGLFTFPLESAPALQTISMPEHGSLTIELLDWPLTCIRLKDTDRKELLDTASKVLHWWKDYDDPDSGVVAYSSDGMSHNTITPIARLKEDGYQLDLILRCNITSNEHPLGLFHPHEEVHCVKKENIGLIEAMGLAILPPRVKEQFVVTDDAAKSDRSLVGNLFTRGLEQCGVLPTEEARKRAVTSLCTYLSSSQDKLG